MSETNAEIHANRVILQVRTMGWVDLHLDVQQFCLAVGSYRIGPPIKNKSIQPVRCPHLIDIIFKRALSTFIVLGIRKLYVRER